MPPHVSSEEFQQAGESLIEAILEVLPQWARSHVVRLGGYSLVEAGKASGVAAAAGLAGELRALIDTDSDLQSTTPLAIVRRAVAWPTAVLTAAGVVPGPRDPFTADRFPEDIYEITPASWSDFGEEVNDLGIRWGVMKALLHKQRHSGQ
jgi:hypothetical protein